MPDQKTTIACPDCEGRGNVAAFVDGERDGVAYGHFDHRARCLRCMGRGLVPAQALDWMSRGRALASLRRAKMESLNTAARRLGMSAVEMSAMENGKADPAPLERAWQ